MSDQDFFFDDEDKPATKAEKAPAKKSSSSRPAAKSSAPRPAAPAPSGAAGVSMTVAILIAVIALLFGMIIGLFMNTLSGGGSTESNVNNTGSSTVAPSLTQDQVQGGLPAGHPSISGSTSTGGSTSSGSSTAK